MAKSDGNENVATLRIVQDGRSPGAQLAEAVMDGVAPGAVTAFTFAQPTWQGTDLTSCMQHLQAQVAQVNGGELRTVEGMLYGQAVALSVACRWFVRLVAYRELIAPPDTNVEVMRGRSFGFLTGLEK